MTTVYLVRHGEAEGNLYRRCHGVYNSLLTPRGYQQIEKLAEIYQSKEWLFPPRFHADLSLQQRFEWGSITLQLALSGDQIIRCGIDSDAMAIEPLQQLQQALSGCPLQEGLQMANALLHHGVEVRMCLFHGESHGLSRIGKRHHRLRRLKEITEWMDRWLKQEER